MKLSERMNGISTNINALRFVAAVFVIFSHSFYVAASKEDPFSVLSNGQTNFGGIAVAIFFFLSGFYVTKSLYKKNDVQDFFVKRCVRIFPQLWIVVIMSILILGTLLTTLPIGEYFLHKDTYLYLLNGFLVPIHNLPGVFTKNIYDATVNGPLWTMPVEFFAYCVLAVVLFVSKSILKREKIQKIFHVMCLCFLALIFVILDVVIKNDFLITTVRPLVIFFIGVIYCDYADKIKLNIALAIFMIPIIMLACKIEMLNYALLICLPYVVVTLALGLGQMKFHSKILNISYEMYLFGWPIQQMVTQSFGGEMNPYLNCIITLPIDLVLAWGLYVLIEKWEKRGGKQR